MLEDDLEKYPDPFLIKEEEALFLASQALISRDYGAARFYAHFVSDSLEAAFGNFPEDDFLEPQSTWDDIASSIIANADNGIKREIENDFFEGEFQFSCDLENVLAEYSSHWNCYRWLCEKYSFAGDDVNLFGAYLFEGDED